MKPKKRIASPDFSPKGCTNFEAKQDTRRKTLAIVRDTLLTTVDGALAYDWVELCGASEESGDEMFQMLLNTPGFLVPGKGKYIGVSNDRRAIEWNKRHYQKETESGLCEWFLGEWDGAVQRYGKKAGVLVFDSFIQSDRERLAAILRPTLTKADEIYAKNGASIVVSIVLVGNPRKGKAKEFGEKFATDIITNLVSREVVPDTYKSRTKPMFVYRVVYGM